MTTLIGYRWKGSNVRSRVVLIVRQACAHACPRLGGGGNDLYFFLFVHTLYLMVYVFLSFKENPVPLLCHRSKKSIKIFKI